MAFSRWQTASNPKSTISHATVAVGRKPSERASGRGQTCWKTASCSPRRITRRRTLRRWQMILRWPIRLPTASGPL